MVKTLIVLIIAPLMLHSQSTSISISPPQPPIVSGSTGQWTGFFLIATEQLTVVTNPPTNLFDFEGKSCSGYWQVFKNGLVQTSTIDYNFIRNANGVLAVTFITPPNANDTVKLVCLSGTWKETMLISNPLDFGPWQFMNPPTTSSDPCVPPSYSFDDNWVYWCVNSVNQLGISNVGKWIRWARDKWQ